MRLQLPKFRNPENPHKYWVFWARRSYTVAAEQKARVTYDNLLRLIDDPDIIEPLKFLREREIVHYQRFGEAMRLTSERLDSRNFYAFNPGFDTRPCGKREQK